MRTYVILKSIAPAKSKANEMQIVTASKWIAMNVIVDFWFESFITRGQPNY